LDDLVDRPDLIGDADDHLRWQLRWIITFGELSGEPEACRTAAQILKTPLDSVIVWARVLRAAVVGLQPTSLAYLGPSGAEEEDPFHHGHLQFWPKLGDLPLAARLLPLLARDLSIPLQVTASARSSEGHDQPAPRTPTSRVRARVAPLRHLSVRRSWPMGHTRSTLFTWTGGYGLRAIARAERAEGARVLYLQRGGTETAILGLGPLGYEPICGAVPYGPRPTRHALPKGTAALLNEVDERAGIAGAGDSLRRRLETHGSFVLPLIERLATALGPHLASTSTERIVSTNAWSVEEFGALLAAQRSGIERVLYQHGDHAFSYDGWLLTETSNFDRMVASDPTVPPDLHEGGRRLDMKTPAMSFGRHRVSGSSRKRAADGTVCYVPAILTGDTAVRPSVYFEDSWYIRWQLRLLAEMGKRAGTRFVWKGLPTSGQADDPLPSIIHREGISNVRYESLPFLEILPQVSRVVLDFPSTAMYEAVWAGVPTTCVSFPRFAGLRKRALELFSGVLHQCEDEEAALTVIRCFLDSPERHVVEAVGEARQRLLGPW